MKIRVMDIVRGTTVDGPGFRTAVYFAGCNHRCPGCHNPQSWDFDAGVEMDEDEIMAIIREEDFDVTFSGGDPLYYPEAVGKLAARIVESGYNLWIYTGFTWEEIADDPVLFDAVSKAEAVVEGRFIKEYMDPDLKFRGSANQRIISPANGEEL